jgi:hypothetical protein
LAKPFWLLGDRPIPTIPRMPLQEVEQSPGGVDRVFLPQFGDDVTSVFVDSERHRESYFPFNC